MIFVPAEHGEPSCRTGATSGLKESCFGSLLTENHGGGGAAEGRELGEV